MFCRNGEKRLTGGTWKPQASAGTSQIHGSRKPGGPGHELMPFLGLLEGEDKRVLREKGQQRFVIDNDCALDERMFHRVQPHLLEIA